MNDATQENKVLAVGVGGLTEGKPSLGVQRSGRSWIWEESYLNLQGKGDHMDTHITGI